MDYNPFIPNSLTSPALPQQGASKTSQLPASASASALQSPMPENQGLGEQMRALQARLEEHEAELRGAKKLRQEKARGGRLWGKGPEGEDRRTGKRKRAALWAVGDLPPSSSSSSDGPAPTPPSASENMQRNYHARASRRGTSGTSAELLNTQAADMGLADLVPDCSAASGGPPERVDRRQGRRVRFAEVEDHSPGLGSGGAWNAAGEEMARTAPEGATGRVPVRRSTRHMRRTSAEQPSELEGRGSRSRDLATVSTVGEDEPAPDVSLRGGLAERRERRVTFSTPRARSEPPWKPYAFRATIRGEEAQKEGGQRGRKGVPFDQLLEAHGLSASPTTKAAAAEAGHKRDARRDPAQEEVREADPSKGRAELIESPELRLAQRPAWRPPGSGRFKIEYHRGVTMRLGQGALPPRAAKPPQSARADAAAERGAQREPGRGQPPVVTGGGRGFWAGWRGDGDVFGDAPVPGADGPPAASSRDKGAGTRAPPRTAPVSSRLEAGSPTAPAAVGSRLQERGSPLPHNAGGASGASGGAKAPTPLPLPPIPYGGAELDYIPDPADDPMFYPSSPDYSSSESEAQAGDEPGRPRKRRRAGGQLAFAPGELLWYNKYRFTKPGERS